MKEKKSARSILNFRRVILFISFAVLLSFFPSPNAYFETAARTAGLFFSEDIVLPPPPPYPVNNTGAEVPPITASGIYIVDIPSNVVLYKKNENNRFLPASTTKIATALVALDYYRLEDIVKIKTVVNDGRKMGLIPDEEITVESLLYGTLVHSANDAAYALADNYPGGVKEFVVAMNKKAKDLHLDDTHFSNPVGFDDEANYSTPKDLAQLAKSALDNKIISKIIGIKSITVSDVNFTRFHELTNVNELLGKVVGVAGIKTGFTDNAGEILISEVKRNGKNVLFVVMKSNDRFGETIKLLDWVFSNFSWRDIKNSIPDN